MEDVKLLALDFDGVISDSAPEAFLVAMRTYMELRPDTSLGLRFDDPGGIGGVEGRRRLAGDPLYRDFVALMPLGNRAEDYAVVLAALENCIELPDQAAYDDLFAREAPEFLRGFHERFYRERTAFSRASAAAWGAWMSPYAPFVEVLRRRAGEAEYAIATAKDAASVALLLDQYRIADLFETDRIFDKESGRSKRAHLEKLRERADIGFDEISFVDDKLNHLIGVADLGVDCVLAAWGYNGIREVREARRLGYRVCGLDDVEARLFDDS